MDPEPGICPSCRDAGEVPRPCPERGCRVRGYHFIPRAYASAPRLDPEVGFLLEERYLLVDRLGEGGFGKVFVALDCVLDTKVALKLLKAGADPEAHEKRTRLFELEAKVLARLSHPNIVQLKDFGLFEGEPYLVLEFIDGGRTLAREVLDRARERRALELGEVEAILAGVLYGLEEAHRLQIVHRDIKPDNIMLQAKPGHPILPRILDFGIAKLADTRPQSSTITGTPDYMAPEQVTRGEIGPWTDLYALGVMAYEFMTGRRPFQGDLLAILSAKCDPAYDPLEAVADLDLRAPVRAFLRSALAFDPRDRYRTAPEFRVAMQAAFAAARGAGQRTVSVGDLVTVDRLGGRASASTEARARAARARGTKRRRWLPALALVGAAALGAGGVLLATRPGGPASEPVAGGHAPGDRTASASPPPHEPPPEKGEPEATRGGAAPDGPDAVSAPWDSAVSVAQAEVAVTSADAGPEAAGEAAGRCQAACAEALAAELGLAASCEALCRDPAAAPADASAWRAAAEAHLATVPVHLAVSGTHEVPARWTTLPAGGKALELLADADLGAFAVWADDGRNAVLPKGTRILACAERPLIAWARVSGANRALAACLRLAAGEGQNEQWPVRPLVLVDGGGREKRTGIALDPMAAFVRASP